MLREIDDEVVEDEEDVEMTSERGDGALWVAMHGASCVKRFAPPAAARAGAGEPGAGGACAPTPARGGFGGAAGSAWPTAAAAFAAWDGCCCCCCCAPADDNSANGSRSFGTAAPLPSPCA